MSFQITITKAFCKDAAKRIDRNLKEIYSGKSCLYSHALITIMGDFSQRVGLRSNNVVVNAFILKFDLKLTRLALLIAQYFYYSIWLCSNYYFSPTACQDQLKIIQKTTNTLPRPCSNMAGMQQLIPWTGCGNVVMWQSIRYTGCGDVAEYTLHRMYCTDVHRQWDE